MRGRRPWFVRAAPALALALTPALMLMLALAPWHMPHARAEARTISGYAQYADLRRGAQVTVTVRDQAGHRVASAVTNEAGEFEMVVPSSGPWFIRAVQADARSAVVELAGDATDPAPVVLTLTDVPVALPPLDITASKPRSSGAVYAVTRRDIDTLPRGNNVDLTDVLATLPGATGGSLKQTHLRQEHANLQFRIDGVPIPDTITTQFTDLLHPRAWERADVRIGGLNAEYGNRTTAVIDITGKSGASPGNRAVQLFGGGNDTVQPSLEYGGTLGARLRWYVMHTAQMTSRGIDPPTLGQAVHHDRSERHQTYLRGDYQLNARQHLTWLVLNSVADYQIPTSPGQAANDDIADLIRRHTDARFAAAPSQAIDENQTEHNQYSHLVWRYHISPARTLNVAGYVRHSRATFTTDPLNILAHTDEPDEPFAAGHQDRWGDAGGVRIDYAHALGTRHVVKAGVQLDRTATINKTRLFAFDRDADAGGALVGGVRALNADRRLLGYRQEVWLQDQFTPNDRWTINAGVRLDHVHGYIDALQVSPRLGVTYALTDRHVFRAYYGRLFTPPALEALPFHLLDTAGTTAAPEDDTNIRPNPERSHAFEVGSTHALGHTAVLQLSAYYKLNTNMADAHQFNSTPLLNAFAYKRGWQRGIEGVVRVAPADGLTARAAVAWGQCRGTGLQSGHFLLHEEELADIDTGVFCDHMQTVTSSARVTYQLTPRTAVTGQMLFGSGLRSHEEGAKTNSSHADSHTTYNLSVTHVPYPQKLRGLRLGIDAVNLFDQREWLNIAERSIGLGVSHANLPRTIFVRAQWGF